MWRYVYNVRYKNIRNFSDAVPVQKVEPGGEVDPDSQGIQSG